MEIHAYGGGEVLSYIFNGVAMLTHGVNGNFMIKIALTIGSIVAFVIAAIKNDPLYGAKWLAWYTAALSLMFLPKMTMVVNDVVTAKKYPVAHVPWILGKTAGTISTFSYGLTKQFENVFRTPGNFTYHQTGSLFASRLMEDSNDVKITDATVKQNFNQFVSQCVFLDLAIGGKYTFDDLLKTPNLWGMLKDNASQVRFFPYLNSDTKTSELVTCKMGADGLHAKWNKIVSDTATSWGMRYFPTLSQSQAKAKLLENLGLANQFLAKTSISANQIIQQKLMSNVVKDGLLNNTTKLNSSSAAIKFAADRAYEQQKNAYIVNGKLAAKTLVNMKALFEGLIYALFPLVMILSLMTPTGHRQLLTYGGLILWVNSWPMVYAVLNFFMTHHAAGQSVALLAGGLDGASMAASSALSQINADIAAQAGYLSMSIPFISYAIIKGGAASFMQLAGHLGGIAQSAATSASHELTTGNYSFGNVNSGNMSYANTSANKFNTDSVVQSGSSMFRDSDGMSITTTASGQSYVSVPNSTLRDDFRLNEQVSSELSRQASSSLDLARQEQESFASSKQEALSKTMALTDAYTDAKNNKTDWYNNMSTEDRQAFDKLVSIRDEAGFSKDRNNMQEIAARGSAGLSITPGGIIGKAAQKIAGAELKAEASLGGSSTNQNTEKYSRLENAMNSEEAKQALSTALSASKSSGFGESQSRANSLAEGITSSTNEAMEHRSARDTYLKEHESLSNQASLANNKSSSYGQNLSQDYVNYLGDKLQRGDMQYAEYENALKGDSLERRSWGERFAKEQSAGVRADATSNMDGFNDANELRSIFDKDSNALQKLGGNDYQQQVKTAAQTQGVWGQEVSGEAHKHKAEQAINHNQTNIHRGNDNVQDLAQARRDKAGIEQDKSLLNATAPDFVPEHAGKLAGKVGQRTPLAQHVKALQNEPSDSKDKA